MKIGLLSDTHSAFDNRILDYFQYCDEIWHAGDIGNFEVIEKLQAITKQVRIVYGNIDDHLIRRSFPEKILFTCENLKIVLIHIAGNPPTYNSTVKKIINEFNPNLLICGHSHITRVLNDKKNNLLYINPGAAGNHGFHKVKTIMTFEINEKKIENMKVVELGKRGKID